MARRAWLFAAILLVAPGARAALTQAPAALSGTVVTDETNSTPVRRATVMLQVPGDVRRQWITTTDDTGRFSFDRLPSGNVTVYASKPGYIRTYDGARRPGSTVGVPIAVTEGVRSADITLRMTRGAVITGTVRDGAGKGMPAVPVRIRRVVVSPAGERSLAPLATGLTAASGTTDDRGIYRVFGLPPGEYVVSAQPTLRGAAPIELGLTGELRQPTVAELQWAERLVRMTPAGPPPPDAAPQPNQPIAYATVFYPGTADLSAAATVSVGPGEERSGIDLPVQFVATARIDGTVVDQNGQPATGVQVTLMPRSSVIDEAQRQAQVEVGLLFGDLAQRTGADGAFSLPGVAPGPYTLMVRTVARAGPTGAAPAPAPSTTLWAMADVDVNGRDIQGISLRLAPGMAVSGRVVFEGSAAQSSGAGASMRVAVRLSPAASSGVQMQSQIAASPTSPTVFAIMGVVPGRYRLTAAVVSATPGVGTPWGLKSVIGAGRDLADSVIEIRAGEDLTDVVVTLTDTLAGVSGVVYDGAGRASSDLSLMLFSAEKSQWFQNSRRLRQPVRAASDGRFAFTGLPAGEYFLAALNDFEPSDWFNPQFLEQAAAGAIRITLGEGEKKTQDVRLSR